MRFALRDDDTNFFTSPDTLYECYHDLWHVVPPSLSLITKVKGNWPKWLAHIYEHKENSDWKGWQKDDKVYPIEQNENLVQFLKQELALGKIDLCYHAKHHRNEDAVLPAEIQGNYIRGAEYYTQHDRSEEIIKELNHLTQLFRYQISVFTPPQNLLSQKGYQSVLKAGLNICGGGISFYKKERDLQGLQNLLKQLSFKIFHKGDDYPFVLYFSHHTEIPYHYPLQPNTPLETLISQFEAVRRYDGDFVLSTHYAEFNYKMTYNNKLSMKNVLEEFLTYISRYEIEYMTLSKLLDNGKAGIQRTSTINNTYTIQSN